MSLGMSEILLILLVVVLLFGGKKIPELARAFGRASHEFKKAKETIANEVDSIKEAAELEEKKLDKTAKETAALKENNK